MFQLFWSIQVKGCIIHNLFNHFSIPVTNNAANSQGLKRGRNLGIADTLKFLHCFILMRGNKNRILEALEEQKDTKGYFAKGQSYFLSHTYNKLCTELFLFTQLPIPLHCISKKNKTKIQPRKFDNQYIAQYGLSYDLIFNIMLIALESQCSCRK